MNETIPSKVVKKFIHDIFMERSIILDEETKILSEEEMEKYGVTFEFSAEVGWNACAARILADEIKSGGMSIQEGIESLTAIEKRKLKEKCYEYIEKQKKQSKGKDEDGKTPKRY